jgi:N-ethylmaleimide reductase
MAPLTRGRATRDHVPTPIMVDYYRQRASAGLIISEATGVSRQGLGWPYAPGIWSDEQVAAWRPVTQAVHEAGGRIIVQLWHMGRQVHSSVTGEQPVSSSATATAGNAHTYEGKAPFETARPLGLDEIPGLIETYVRAAHNAIAAGFDGIQIHAANGYLIDQFINSNSNHRTDAYGGSIENRTRFLFEVVDAVAGAVGADRVGVRLTPMGRFIGMGDDTPEQTFGHIARALGPRGLAYLHLVEPTTLGVETDTAYDPRWNAIIRLMRALYPGKLLLAGGYDKASAIRALAEGRGDAIAFGKLFIANPDLPRRFALGAPLNAPDPASFFGGDARGYVDYPALPAAA